MLAQSRGCRIAVEDGEYERAPAPRAMRAAPRRHAAAERRRPAPPTMASPIGKASQRDLSTASTNACSANSTWHSARRGHGVFVDAFLGHEGGLLVDEIRQVSGVHDGWSAAEKPSRRGHSNRCQSSSVRARLFFLLKARSSTKVLRVSVTRTMLAFSRNLRSGASSDAAAAPGGCRDRPPSSGRSRIRATSLGGSDAHAAKVQRRRSIGCELAT